MGEWFLHQGICLTCQRHTCYFCFLDLHKVRLKGLSSHTPLLVLVTGEGEMSDMDMDLVPTFWPFACRPPSLALGFLPVLAEPEFLCAGKLAGSLCSNHLHAG